MLDEERKLIKKMLNLYLNKLLKEFNIDIQKK